ncbi:DUF2500 domain-containing protein [Bacillales bacterium AN1005]|uniref:DUF2500 domain-containing protein n=1 Tax=Niallia taxi TaxID=2499688 RepID=UPI0021A7C491|nr:DUF2500 domain-containing protein [Niallia taxi]MCT2346445.1 DUF2500 domain-containing protein [Niallia taxi]
MPDDEFYFGDFLFQFGPIFIGIIFIFVIGSILFTIFKGIGQWHKNEQSPRLSVPAIIKAKRTDVSRGSNNDDNNSLSSSTYTTYYVTFEFESGDRTEFHVSGKEYGLLSENDTGILNFQGTRFLGFERNSINQENT